MRVRPVRQVLEVDLRRQRGEPESRMSVSGVPLGVGPGSFARLDRRLSLLARADTSCTGRIDASAWVPHRDVIRCMDAFLAAGVTRVDFVGAPPPRGRR